MSPFESYRYWLSTAPVGKRWANALAGLIVMALVVWLVMPDAPAATEVVASQGVDGRQAGAAVDGSATASLPGSTAATSSGTSGSASSGTTPAGGQSNPSTSSGGAPVGAVAPSCPSGQARGLTDEELHVVVILLSIAGPLGNSTLGYYTPADQQARYEAVIDTINSEGGIACRRVVASYLEGNPADQSQLEQVCRDAVAMEPFAVLDAGAFPVTGPACFAIHETPFFGNYVISTRQANQGYPYLFQMTNWDTLYHDTVIALDQLSFFDPANGFGKLGIVDRSCFPELFDQMIRDLGSIGVGESQISSYDLGCPLGFASPADIQQAVLQFKADGVTHATYIFAVADMGNFTDFAEAQGFRPVWGFGDDSGGGGSSLPNPNNIDGALLITQSRYGEASLPGDVRSPATIRCDTLYAAHGFGTTYEMQITAGNACNELFLLKAALDNAPSLAQDALAAGLQAAGSVDLAYPMGPNNFTGPNVTWGGQFWRSLQYAKSCECWQLTDQTFRPSFP